ncbi:MAG: glutamate--cysteine ligase [Gammaproteobacteria bacterium]|nr:glutamate--cysteine ligase [Gammaproteobacteria bacterium]
MRRYQLPEFDPEWGAVLRGIEKESLRVSPEGQISLAGHPKGLGSALTNPYITTDFSEALLEFITPALHDIDECMQVLENIHRFTLQNLENDEMLWISSMPCPIGAEAEIPIAQYGSSNIGQLKTLYRHGLHHRYGSLMQVIAGIHYNFSMPEVFWEPYQKICQQTGSIQDFRTERYLCLIRNFHRYSWLLIYLFGASPAASKCFGEGRDHDLQVFDETSLFLPDATCLRMGNLGYKSEAQKSLFVCYNDLQTYVDCLYQAMHTPYPEYESIGQKVSGEYAQININLLQLENEFYSTIRPKRNVQSGERPLDALTNSGIEYVEVRALDLDPYAPLGITAEQVRFLDTFLLHCLLAESPDCDEREFFEVASNIAKVVECGRDLDLKLELESRTKGLKEWSLELMEDLGHSAGLLDEAQGGTSYSESLSNQLAKVNDPNLTPSGRMLREMREAKESFFDFSMRQSKAHHSYLIKNGLNEQTVNHMRATAKESHDRQKEIEARDDLIFDDFLTQWNKA